MPHLFRVVLFAALHAAATGGPRAAPKRGPTQRTVDSDFQTPNFKQFYYISLNMKAAESASLGQCVMTVGKPGDSAQKTGPKNLFAVETSSVNPAIVPNEIFHAFTHSLCVLHEVRSYFIRKQANSCTRAGSMNPREVRAGHLHPRHPRCDPDNADSLKKYCNSNNEINVVDWSEHRIRTATRPPFLVTTSHAVISKSGMIWQPCGLVGLMNSCGAIRYRYFL